MKITLRGNKIGVEKGKKKSKEDSSPLIVMPESGDNVGIIRFLGEDAPKDLTVGMKVVYGTARQRVETSGMILEIMENDNVFAILGDLDEKEIKS